MPKDVALPLARKIKIGMISQVEDRVFIGDRRIFDAQSGALLGAHLLGAEATELIQGFAVAKTLETTEAELIASIFPHPTLSEMMGESVLDAFGRVLHI